MNDSIHSDLLAAHADALTAGEVDYDARFSQLFSDEVTLLEPLLDLAVRIFGLLHRAAPMRAEFRAGLKAELLAASRQQRLTSGREHWQWAALGASVTVAGVIAAAAWRNNHYRGAI